MIPAGLVERVAALLGPRGYLDRSEDLTLYEYDGGVDKHPPDLVAFPRTTQMVAALVPACRASSMCRWSAAARAPDCPAARSLSKAGS